mmetsp:Transcript_116804/g.371762  ORF Transcript_116804/g.371762 Transcript_116804/m.371762 type:complete len:207 (+) Transcript_116804:1416-2036(+)
MPTTLHSGMPPSSEVRTESWILVCTGRKADVSLALLNFGGPDGTSLEFTRRSFGPSFGSFAVPSHAVEMASTQAKASSSLVAPNRRILVGPAPCGNLIWKQCSGSPCLVLRPGESARDSLRISTSSLKRTVILGSPCTASLRPPRTSKQRNTAPSPSTRKSKKRCFQFSDKTCSRNRSSKPSFKTCVRPLKSAFSCRNFSTSLRNL